MDLKINQSKLGTSFGSIGLLVGLFYAMKERKGVAVTGLYALGFGAVGLIIGNQVTKFYE